MGQTSVLKCRGLYTFPNALSEIPDGALSEATNVVIDRESVITPRRGYRVFGNSLGSALDRASQLLTYKGRVLRHYNTVLDYDSTGSGAFSPFGVTLTATLNRTSLTVSGLSSTASLFVGQYVISSSLLAGTTVASIVDGTTVTLSQLPPANVVGASLIFATPVSQAQTGLRIRSIESNGNLYFTSGSGIRKLSITDASVLGQANITSAGGVKALDGFAGLNSSTGFFLQDSTVAYRVVWGIKDANNNLLLGEPSPRIVITNPITGLLASDFNSLLLKLDICVTANTGGTLLDGNSGATSPYISLKVSTSANASTIDTALRSLCLKLDTDMGTSNYYGKSGSISTISTANPAVITTAAAHGLSNGDTVIISGSNSAPSIDGTYKIAGVTASTFTIPAVATVAGTTGAWKQSSLVNTHNIPSTNPTSEELVALQSFYDGIVTSLLTEPTSNITSAGQTAGSFQKSTQSGTVNLTFTVPQNVTTNHIYQVYRSALFQSSGVGRLSSLEPDDELQLVYEASPAQADITSQYVTLTDITPDSFRGASLYTNPTSGQTLAQSNTPPPLSNDIALFKGSTFYANTQTKHGIALSLLSGTSLAGTSLSIAQSGTTKTYNFVASVKQVSTITCTAGSTFSAGPSSTGYVDIWVPGNATRYRFWFQTGTNAAPSPIAGTTLVQTNVALTDTAAQIAQKLANTINARSNFYATVSSNVITVTNEAYGSANAPSDTHPDVTLTTVLTTAGSGEDATVRNVGLSNALTPAQVVDETVRSLVRVMNKDMTGLVYADYISSFDDIPGKMFLQARSLGTAAFSITVSSSSISGKFNPSLPTNGTTVKSDNEVTPNRVYYSKFQQPEAVPLLNYIDVGARDKKILRIVSLRDSLFIFKQDGIFRLSGDNVLNFQVTLFDNSTFLLASDTACVLNNKIYALTTQGVATVDDGGVSVISRPIEDRLVAVTTPDYPFFPTASFAVSYESDRSYLLWIVKDPTDVYATQCYRFNTFTELWTEFDLQKTCAVVNTANDRLYLGCADLNSIEEERKSFTRLDYADREQAVVLPVGSVNGTTISAGSTFGLAKGDAIVQVQYLTISQFNRLLRKLDKDPLLTYKNYYSSFQGLTGQNLSDTMIGLAAQLNAEPGTLYKGYTASSTTDFSSWQTQFNTIIAHLNTDNGLYFKDYVQSTGTVSYEGVIANILLLGIRLLLTVPVPFLAGNATVYAHINSSVTWAPSHFGDPSMTKHVREATVMLENSDFTTATASYASDLSPGFESITCVGDGSGIWGGFNWGTANWGGSGTNRPIRTLVPRNKARCRYITCRFTHGTTFERYGVLGISFTFEPISSRGYR